MGLQRDEAPLQVYSVLFVFSQLEIQGQPKRLDGHCLGWNILMIIPDSAVPIFWEACPGFTKLFAFEIGKETMFKIHYFDTYKPELNYNCFVWQYPLILC